MTEPAPRRRILVMVNEVFDTAGGNLRAAVNVAQAMAQYDDFEVTFTAPFVASAPHATVDSLDPRVARKLFVASRPLARFGGSVRQFLWLARNARRFDQVQVHSLFHLSAVYVIVVCAIRRVPVVLWPHGTLDPFDLRKHASLKRVLGRLVTRRLLSRCAALVFTSEYESQIAVTYGATVRRAVIPLPVTPITATSGEGVAFRARFDIPVDAPVVLFLGRVNYKKGLPLLVESLARLADKRVHLVVAGDGPAEDVRMLQQAAADHGMTHRMRTTGWIEGDLRSAAFWAADIFALLSDSENFGLALMEALSAGVPAVISDQVFIADDLARAGAVLVVPRSAEAAADAFARVLGDRDGAAAMGERGLAYVRDHFGSAAASDRMRRL